MAQRRFEELSEEECFRLARECSVGRFLFIDETGPAGVPVNFGLAGDQIVFRVEKGASLLRALDRPVAFQVDAIDDAQGSGWSVLIRGRAYLVPPDQVPKILKYTRAAFPRPWAEGVHREWISISPEKVTGRRLAGQFFQPEG